MNNLIRMHLCAAVLGISSMTIPALSQAEEAANVDAASAAVETATVTVKQVGESLLAYGVLDPDPDQVLSLSLPHAGLINRVWVRAGQRIKNGDKLLEVVTSPDSRMQYLQAQSAVDFATRELERSQRLLKEQLATKAQVDAAGKSLRDARDALDALRKRGLDQSKKTMLAPMDGIVTRLDVSQGQRAQADTTAMLIADENRLIARLGVEAEDLGRLEPGTPVTLSSVFVPGIRVESRIREVHAMIDPDTHLVEVLVAIPQPQVDHLVLGSRILGRIRLPTHTALVVPRSAVLGEGPDACVYTVAQGKARRITVRTGIEQADDIEISSEISGALKAGDTVVTLGNYELQDGMDVRAAH